MAYCLAQLVSPWRSVRRPNRPPNRLSQHLILRIRQQYAEAGDYEAAIASYTQAMALDPANAAAYISRSSAYAALARYDMAIDDLNAAIEINPDLPAAYVARQLYARIGDQDRPGRLIQGADA